MFAGALAVPGSAGAQSPASFVDPLIGTAGDGNTYPGAKVPFGFVSASPDTTSPTTGGYNAAGRIVGFSQTHVSGTGGGGQYGNFRLTPVSSLRATDLDSEFSREIAKPGSYSVTLGREGIRASATATRLAAIYRFHYRPGAEKHVVLDTTSVLDLPGGQSPVSSDTEIVDGKRIEGSASFRGGWQKAGYKLYFSVRFDRKVTAAGTLKGGALRGKPTVHGGPTDRTGAYASFGGGGAEVRAKIGVSFVSVARARANGGTIRRFDFARTRRAAEREWALALEGVTVAGGSAAQRTVLHTAVYHSQLMPHDLTGENVWWKSRVPHYEDYYTLWDTFRTLHPLLTLIQRKRQAQMVESLVDTYRHNGWMPDARITGRNGLTQGGSNGDVLVADAAVKGLTGIDYKTALKALIKNGNTQSPRPMAYGRELNDYRQIGFVPYPIGRSASRTLEYSYNDFAIAQVANAQRRPDVAQLFLARSHNWKNLWDPATRTIRPRLASGAFVTPFEPHLGSPEGATNAWDSPFYEGTPRQYSAYVPHEIARLIEKVGGDEAFAVWLDELFYGKRYDPGNEPGLLAPWLFIHAGRPDKTADRVREVLAQYTNARNGIPGNDDAGALSSWYVWGALGLYPNAGQPFYYIGSPLFGHAQIDVGKGRTFKIEAPGTSDANRYVQSATLNGGPLARAWVTHQEVAGGGTLVLRMGPQPSPTWGRSERPPSL